MTFFQGDNNWSSDDGSFDVWNGELVNPHNPQNFRNPVQDRVFTDQFGRRCRTVTTCSAAPRRRPNLQAVARSIVGQNIVVAQRSNPHVVIRPVIENGHHLPTTMDFRQDRINVETRNNIITRIVGFN